jgi:hypothetical protein
MPCLAAMRAFLLTYLIDFNELNFQPFWLSSYPRGFGIYRSRAGIQQAIAA